MKLIRKNNLTILEAEEGCLIKGKNDNGEILEDGTYIEPHLTNLIFLAKQITTLEQAQELYEEIYIEENIKEE